MKLVAIHTVYPKIDGKRVKVKPGTPFTTDAEEGKRFIARGSAEVPVIEVNVPKQSPEADRVASKVAQYQARVPVRQVDGEQLEVELKARTDAEAKEKADAEAKAKTGAEQTGAEDLVG